MTRRILPLDRLRDLLPSARGLTSAEIRERRARYGPNDIIEIPGRPFLDLVRDTAKDPMIWFLVGTGVIYALIGERVEALTLLVAILPLIGMDAFLHRRTRASTAGLESRLASTASILRDGSEIEVRATEVVPGDLALVSAGDVFPADGIVIDETGLQVDESALTGEAYPIRKTSIDKTPADGEEPFVEGTHWGFAGTRVLTGNARLRVVFTGGETLYGEIVRSAVRGEHARTPLQAAIANLVSVLVGAAALMCLILAFVRLRQGYGWVDALVSAVTLAVAAIPEEFPVVFTFFLGVGVYRLAKRQALVRRAVSVENIGRTSTICSDKTGTITEGRLSLTHLVPAPGIAPEQLLGLAALASRYDSHDPLDTAILQETGARGALSQGQEILATFPFTEDRKRETVVLREAGAMLLAATKGAAEVVLGMAALDDAAREHWMRQVIDLAEAGHKVIACASRPLADGSWAGGEPDRGFTMSGLLALEDPVREGVAQAIHRCAEVGIHTIMVTGDHPATALAVAREIGLGGGQPVVISGDEMESRLSGSGALLERVDVIARAVPSQKLTLVRALQASGEIVAVTGDGVNDVPALQAADIGVAMGERGTRSAREASSIILLDDNFRTIVRAIGEGQQLFKNLTLSFEYLLAIHIPLVTTAALIPLAGFPLLYLPIHIVWLEMIIHPTAMLAFQDLPDEDRLEPARRERAERLFSSRDWAIIGGTGLLITALVTLGYLNSLDMHQNAGHGRAMALAILTLSSAALCATLSRLRAWAPRVIAAGTVVLSVALIQTPPLARLLHLKSLHWTDWGIAAAGATLAAMLPMRLGRHKARPKSAHR